jgi:hypothetical protein
MKKEQLMIVIGIVSALGGMAAFFTYMESRKSRKTQEEIADLDRQLKSLQLQKLQTA